MAEALEQLKNIRTLAELNPRIGEKVQVETRTPRARYSLQLLGYRENGSLMVSAPRNSKAINEGALVNVRLMSGNFICGFSAKVLKINTSPFAYWHLEYPKNTEVRRIRSHTRVPVNLRVSIDEYEPGSGIGGIGGMEREWPTNAFCSDISLKGARVQTQTPLGKVGDKVFITTRFAVAGVDQVILAPAEIRSVASSDEGINKVMNHGLEFLELDEETHLILTGFVYQQFLMETGHLEILRV